MRTPDLPPLLLILDTKRHDASRIAHQACQAGVRALVWRARELNGREFWQRARALSEIAVAYGADLLIHDRVDVALATAADGVHLPSAGLPPRRARRLLGSSAILGQSLHTLEELQGAPEALDYATLSPIFKTPSKPGYGPALGLEALAEAAASAPPRLALYALGGVTPERASACLKAGAHGVAVMGGICHAEDVYEASLKYLEAIHQSAPS